jgi:hypothetical protein
MIRKEVHTRGNFAKDMFRHYTELLSQWLNTKGSLIGNNPQKYLKKLNQCNSIWHHYTKEYAKQ